MTDFSHSLAIAIIPIEELELHEALENAVDIHEARLALKEIKKHGAISHEEMKRRLQQTQCPNVRPDPELCPNVRPDPEFWPDPEFFGA